MKFKVAGLLLACVLLSGFTWGSDDEKKPSSTTKTTSSSSYSAKPAGSVSRSSVPSSSVENTNNRASAIKILTQGTEAERKARMDSLSRIAKSVAEAKKRQNATAKKAY